MNITDIIQGAVGNQLVNGLSRKLGVENSKISSAVSMALPFLLSQMNKNASTQEGAESLSKALTSHQDKDLNNVSSFLNNTEGMGILNHIFGNNQESVVNNIGQNTGISSGNVMQILSTLAPIVMGFLGKEQANNNVDSNNISGLLGGFLGNMRQSNNSQISMIEKYLDQDGDGNLNNEIKDLGNKFLGGLFKK